MELITAESDWAVPESCLCECGPCGIWGVCKHRLGPQLITDANFAVERELGILLQSCAGWDDWVDGWYRNFESLTRVLIPDDT